MENEIYGRNGLTQIWGALKSKTLKNLLEDYRKGINTFHQPEALVRMGKFVFARLYGRPGTGSCKNENGKRRRRKSPMLAIASVSGSGPDVIG